MLKEERQSAILDLIRHKAIETQTELSSELQLKGYKCTQATISRDIKELHIVKEQNKNGVYVYAPPYNASEKKSEISVNDIFRAGAISCDYANNIVVVRTKPGLANAVAVRIDDLQLPEMLGSIAGDDTIMVVMTSNYSAESFCKGISKNTVN